METWMLYALIFLAVAYFVFQLLEMVLDDEVSNSSSAHNHHNGSQESANKAKICAPKNEPQKQEPEQLYKFNTHPVKYQLYCVNDLENWSSRNLYRTVVLQNLWIDEPFYGSFFKLLLFLDRNEFFIQDSNSKMITLNLRDANNQMVQTKSFQVFSTLEVVESVIEQSMWKILRFKENDAKSIVIAICIIAIQKSEHYQSHAQSSGAVKYILSLFDNSYSVKHIIGLVCRNAEKLRFVNEAFEFALSRCKTHPFVDDSSGQATLLIPSKLPEKVLQHI